MHYTRTLLSLLAVSLLSLAAATPAAASDARLPAPPRTLVFLNWSEYIDPELVEEFEQQFNAKVSEVYFESDDLRDDMMLETGAIGYDLVIVNGINVDSYRKRGWIAPLDQAALPNLKHVDQHWRNAFDSGNGYGVPYFWGTLGIAYRQDLVEQAPSRANRASVESRGTWRLCHRRRLGSLSTVSMRPTPRWSPRTR